MLYLNLLNDGTPAVASGTGTLLRIRNSECRRLWQLAPKFKWNLWGGLGQICGHLTP